MGNYITEAELPDVLKEVSEFANRNLGSRNTFSIVVRNEGKVSVHHRLRRPCFGEMRSYREKSLNRPDDRFPSDLLNNFPDGTPIGVFVLASHNTPSDITLKFWSEVNPYLGNNEEFLKHRVFIKGSDERVLGVLIKTGDILPTHLVAAMMSSRNLTSQTKERAELYITHGMEEGDAWKLALITYEYNQKYSFTSTNTVSLALDVQKYFGSSPDDLDGGLLWSSRADYNRPDIIKLFSNPENQRKEYGRMVSPDKLVQTFKRELGRYD